ATTDDAYIPPANTIQLVASPEFLAPAARIKHTRLRISWDLDDDSINAPAYARRTPGAGRSTDGRRLPRQIDLAGARVAGNRRRDGHDARAVERDDLMQIQRDRVRADIRLRGPIARDSARRRP